MTPEQRAIRLRLAENLERAGYHDDAFGVRQSIEWSDAGLGRLLADVQEAQTKRGHLRDALIFLAAGTLVLGLTSAAVAAYVGML